MIQAISGYLKGDGYAARVVRGSALTVFSFGTETFLRLASNLILTRILFPEAFGLMALVTVVLSGAAQFSDIGIRAAIVRDERGEDLSFLNTAWTLQILRGLLLGGAVYLLATPAARFYEAPELEGLLQLSALVPVVQGFISTRFHSAGRRIHMGRITALALGNQLVSITITIALAWWMGTVWALAIGNVLGAALLVIGTHVFLTGEKNRFRLEGDAARRIITFGKYIFFSTLAGYFLHHGDKLVLGKFVSLADLAIYNIGYFLAAMPLLLSGMLNERIFFPLYARRPPDESEANRKQINKARMATTAGLMSVAALMGLIVDPLVRLLYDVRYEGAGAIATLIALALMPKMLFFSYERMSLAYGHSGRFATLTIGGAVLQMCFLLIGVSQFGLLGAILAPTATALVLYPLMVWINLPYRGWDPLHDILFGAVIAGLAAAVLWYRWDAVMPLWAG